MKLTVLRRDLLPALTAVSRIVEARNTIPILSNIVIDADADGLTLRATDLDIEVRARVAAAVETPAALTVAAGRLRDIVGKLDDGLITLVAGAGAASSVLKITQGRAKFDVMTLPVDDYPDMAAGEPTHSFEMPGDILAHALEGCAFAISTEETRYYLNGVHLHAAEQPDTVATLVMVATDGHRLALRRLALPEGATGMPGIIVPRKTVGELTKLCKGNPHPAAIALSAYKIRVEIGAVTLVSKLIDGTFPDYDRVIPRGNPNAVDLEREALSAAVDRVLTVGATKGRAVKLAVDPTANTLTLEVSDPDSGSATEGMVTGQCDGDGGAFGLNGRYLIDALASLGGDTVHLAYGDAGTPVLLTPFDDQPGDKRLIVVMPMRV